MNTLKAIAIATALIASVPSLAMAQNGLPTGGEPPVAGGANGNPTLDNSRGGDMMSGATMHKSMKHGSMKHHMMMKRDQ